MTLLRLAWKSLISRKLSVALSVFSLSVSVFLFLGVERLRESTQESFYATVSGTDLIVGARSGPIQLLLYSVFRVGNATNNISWQSYTDFKNNEEVDWTIPISLGDSHRGYRVVATNLDYFKYFSYGQSRNLKMHRGEFKLDLFEVVLGSEVAEQLDYEIGDKIVLAHGVGEELILEHDDKLFEVSGILKRTGTAVDRSLHISLQSMEAIHLDWQDGSAPADKDAISAEEVKNYDLSPKQITAFFVGLNSKIGIFNLQREINEYPQEALMAILPAATLQEFWTTFDMIDRVFKFISSFVVIAGLAGMLGSLWSGLNERRREMAILRSIGASLNFIFGLLILEAFLICLISLMVGFTSVYIVLGLFGQSIESSYGLYLEVGLPSSWELKISGIILAAGLVVGLIPAIRAYKQSLIDGLSIRS